MLHSQILNLIERKLRYMALPIKVNFWGERELLLDNSYKVELSIRSPGSLITLAYPSLGKLAKNYVEQEIDLEGDMRDIIRIGEILCDAESQIDKKNRMDLIWLFRPRKSNSKNVSYHYDVSNDFYSLWLDSRLVYSCGYFKNPGDSLDLAQEQKLDHICRKLNLQTDEKFLDIGCGWGGLLFWAAENYGVRATGITLSKNQYDHVSEQIIKRGLQDRCKVRLMDYQEMPETEQYDKISSVGMFEHVGRKNLQKYFGKIYRLLTPGGLVMNHGITSTSLEKDGLGNGIGDFIEQYVFPGGELLHVSSIIESMSRQHLECVDIESLRPHYAKTLWHWVDRLEARKKEAKELIGEKKYRIWQIYMAGSAHAFERGWLSLFQILAGKPLSNGSMPYPFTRDHFYC